MAIPVIGKTTVAFGLGENLSPNQVWIARKQEDYVLEADVLMKKSCVVDCLQQVLRMEETDMLMYSNAGQEKCLRLIVGRSVKIPGYTKMIILARIKGWGTFGPPDLVEGRKGIMVGGTLFDV